MYISINFILDIMFWHVVLAITLLKLLFVPYYTSTDFEVHRNWLAITYSLPLEKWYTESTSEWTLDYPPFFAWFEWGLARIAQYVDVRMLEIQRLPYKSLETLVFQRISVIVCDIILALGAKACADAINELSRKGLGTNWYKAWSLNNELSNPYRSELAGTVKIRFHAYLSPIMILMMEYADSI